MFPYTDVILDIFPHTGDIHAGVSGHVETVVLLGRKKVDSEESFLPNETTDETVVLLSKLKTKQHEGGEKWSIIKCQKIL